MTSNILFHFESNEIRFVGTAENPEWIADDICKALGLDDTSQAVSTLDSDEKGAYLVRNGSLTGSQMLTVTESGLYRLIFKSRKPAAKRMKKWVFSEVLPSIRKNGSYLATDVTTHAIRELPQRDAIEYINATATLATLPDSRLKRLLDARLVAELSIDLINQKQIAPAEEVKNYTTATVRAAMLGYSAKQIGSGSSLGKFIKSEITPDFSDWQGQYSVAHYEVCDALDSRIHAYFLTRSL